LPTNARSRRTAKRQQHNPDYSLDSLVPYVGTDLFQLASQLSPNLAFFLPKHTSLDELSQLTPDDPIEIEEAWFGEKLKAVTVYFGGLVRTSS
jgi:trimethylguanosine synthase